ncbi:MAG: dynamin family protein [archaeon]|nr:dynamin family protein [archaeon]
MAIEDVDNRMREPMQLAIVGRISSSKSTLVNAILGKAEVVRTGHEAETFNVSWLKYGNDDAPIIVHFKNGRKQTVERNEWIEWASHKGQQSLKTEVKYIEVTSSYEMLRFINIIDTPGLDATSKVDSENTISFLKTVNPDAVILLFSKSLSEDTLKLINEFQNAENSISFSINPMNALGILSKVDMNWDVINDNDPVISSDKAIKRTLSSRSDVNKALFRILPVSALMGLSSFTISDDDKEAFEQLAMLDDKKITRLFISPEFFVKEYDFISLSKSRREGLVLKYGLYGVYVCVREIQKNVNVTLQELSCTLRIKSGFDSFIKLVVSHFGDRAQLLKAQRGIVQLLRAINKDRINVDSSEHLNIVNSIYSKVFSVEDDLHELKEWNLLLKIYENKIEVEDEFMQEFLRIVGESGHSAVCKLYVDENTDVSEMIDRAMERCEYWKTKYNVWYGLSPAKAENYAVIAKSYELLGLRLQEQKEKYDKALRAIRIYNHYIYGKDLL